MDERAIGAAHVRAAALIWRASQTDGLLVVALDEMIPRLDDPGLAVAYNTFVSKSTSQISEREIVQEHTALLITSIAKTKD